MNDWYQKYEDFYFRIRYLSAFGNILIFSIAAREIWWFGTGIFGSANIESVMVPNVVWQLTASLAIAGLCLFRFMVLIRLATVRFKSLLLSGMCSAVLLLAYWADAINLWTCYVSDPNSLVCSIYVFGRTDVLAGVGPIYFTCALVKTIVLCTLASREK